MINEALKLMRVYHNMTQKDLAAKLGTAKSYISEIEAGNKTPTLHLLNEYAKLFSVPLSSIMFFAENIEDPSAVTQSRNYVAGKIIKLLGFIAEKADRQLNE